VKPALKNLPPENGVRRSADFQSAVSRISNPPPRTPGRARHYQARPNGIRRHSRLETGATAKIILNQREPSALKHKQQKKGLKI
jgi:hypothetical protein